MVFTDRFARRVSELVWISLLSAGPVILAARPFEQFLVLGGVDYV